MKYLQKFNEKNDNYQEIINTIEDICQEIKDGLGIYKGFKVKVIETNLQTAIYVLISNGCDYPQTYIQEYIDRITEYMKNNRWMLKYIERRPCSSMNADSSTTFGIPAGGFTIKFISPNFNVRKLQSFMME